MIFPPPHPAALPEGAAETLGFDPARLAEATAWARTQESPFPRDLPAYLASGHFEPPPGNEILGPVEPRGAPNGLILRHGRVAARWGDTRQADRTFSVAKSCLSLLAGIAVLDGLIRDLDEPVAGHGAGAPRVVAFDHVSQVFGGGLGRPHRCADQARYLQPGVDVAVQLPQFIVAGLDENPYPDSVGFGWFGFAG